MREKYVEESFPMWFIFGEDLNGLVDVSDGNVDVFVGITREVADTLIRERNILVNALIVAIGEDYERLEQARLEAKSSADL